jgi:hypothetical protein
MILPKQVLKITTRHQMKQSFVTVMVWQATAYCTNSSHASVINKLLANFFLQIWII